MSKAAVAAKKRILVTDDDPSILRLVRAILKRADYEVDTAVNGREALEKIELTHYDVVVLDLTMPEVSGAEVLARLQVRDAKPKFVVIMSAESPDVIAKNAESMNVFAALRKPFEIGDMIATVRACIAGRRDRRLTVRSHEVAASKP